MYVIASIASIALMGMVVCAALAGAATKPPSPAPTEAKAGGAPVKTQMPACPMCPMMAGGGKGMGKGMDMPPAMKRRCQMMMNAEMSRDDAACLLAFKQELKLTPELSGSMDNASVEPSSRSRETARYRPIQKQEK